MTVIAVTGHLDLSEPSIPLIREALHALLSPYAEAGLTGVSCLAPGADTLFAETVLALGGRLIAVIPSADYRTAGEFYHLQLAATEVVTMPFPHPTHDAYEAANTELLHRADRLIAVWDGLPGGGRGGTADAVAAARAAGLPVDVVWPAGAARTG